MAKLLMIQGTCSNAGKSIIVAGLCRIFLEKGYKVAPFKAQNMALNSFVTHDNLEMGRAQVTQAYACNKLPDVRMNPILLKPNSDLGSQVIVMGKPIGSMNFKSYNKQKSKLQSIVKDAFDSLSGENDIIILEGAGSPAEINLKENDIVNMNMAKLVNAPVVIAGDIDRGGVFASFIGTLELFDEKEKALTKGFIINKFRGDLSLLNPGIDILKKRTGKEVFGTIPFIHDLKLPEEDSVEYKKNIKKNTYNNCKDINIALIDLPHISNFTDFDPFYHDEDVNLYTAVEPNEIKDADIIIIPGTKNVIGDLKYLKQKGFEKILKECAKKSKYIIGICGGYQMLGRYIYDPYLIEGEVKKQEGFNLLKITTVLEKEKYLHQVNAVCLGNNIKLIGYEIHHGKTEGNEKNYIINEKNENIGCINGNIWGTYMHGIFDNNYFRINLINEVRKSKKLNPISFKESYSIDNEFNKLANIMKKNLNMEKIYKIMDL